MKKNLNYILCGTILGAMVAYSPMVFAASSRTQQNAQTGLTVLGGASVVAGGYKAATDILGAPAAGATNAITNAGSRVAGSISGATQNAVGGALGGGTATAGAGGAAAGGDAAKGSTGAKCNVKVPGASGVAYHTGIVGYTFDVGSAASRLLSTAIKYFLGDDTDLVAQLVWKDKTGCGGCYTADEMQTATVDLKFAAVMNEISVEDSIYRDGTTVGTECVASLAQDRLDGCIVNQASLNELNAHAWKTQYQAQRRSIQALTDALNMKRLYSEIKDIATSIPNNYSNYAEAMGTVASKRLLLDQLLALKKQVVAARVRVRAQTMELSSVDAKLVTAAPDVKMICK